MTKFLQNNKKNLVIFVLLLLAGSACSSVQKNSTYSTSLQVGQKKIFAQIVTSKEDMAKGLSGRNRLTDEEGMLFDFTNNLPPSLSSEGEGVKPNFWMKDMKFDLDLIWIKNKKIIGITPNVPAPKSDSDALPTYVPPEAVNMVLEVSAGWSERNGVKVGEEIKF